MPSLRKPIPLVVSALYWCVLSVAAFAYAISISFQIGFSGFGAVLLAALLWLTFALLWFLWLYWRGFEWTRTGVMIGLVLKFGYQLFSAYRLHRLPGDRGGRGFLLFSVVDLCFCVFMFFWLLSKDARRYFQFPPPHYESAQPRVLP